MTPLRFAQTLLGAAVPVLCYHQVRPDSGMTPEKFGAQLDLIARLGFRTMRLDRLYDAAENHIPLTEPTVAITFDDCTLDNWVYAVPELAKRGMSGVFFAITDFIRPGAPRLRADQTDQPATCPAFPAIMRDALTGDCAGFMNESEIRALVHDLGMEVHVHSAAHQACFLGTKPVGVLGENRHWSHAALCGPKAPGHTPVYPVGSAYAHPGFGRGWDGRPLELAPTDRRLDFCRRDFVRAKKRLETILGQASPFLCLPWGHYDAVTLDAARLAGYAAVLTLDRASAFQGQGPVRIGRLAVKDKKSRPWLAFKTLCLALPRLAALAGRGRRA